MSILRSRAGPLLILGTSALGGAAYRFTRSSSSDAALNPHTFTPYTLVDKQPVSSTSAIFTLRNETGPRDPESLTEGWKRSVWSVQIKQPQLQIARAYTPLPTTDPTAHQRDIERPAEIRLLIRQEKGGEVSTYLHRLPENATVDLRGPNTEFELPHDIKEVVFLAGGTGIAPAMQVAQALARRTGSRMHILWANRKREECLGGVGDETPAIEGRRSGWWRSLLGVGHSATQEPLVNTSADGEKNVIVRELEALKERNTTHSEGLKVHYYVDEEQTFIKSGDVARKLRLDSTQHDNGSRLILISGPDGFIEYWAGKKIWVGGRETQGPLGGVLSKMDLKDWSVFKL
ncbi:hypothetical protein B0J11DRAFT_309852 [Dendryphion nanum]|uniref:FAD-binding FR-type domain-containing protein n=1 Tax=Dendryphion nanum TaxID=256645 RepID=A0A9P9DV24_9PLEO|nr:hypothetical protein B0J11DRAFT_309852 [Dendryphion nanum]